MITITRLLCAVILMLTVPFSTRFWILYIYCVASDFADGLVARALKQQNDTGAKLDSIADIVFFFVIVVIIIPAVIIPLWAWICVIVITIIRVAAYLIGYKKYHTFSSLHTYANKVTGGFLFVTPVLYVISGITVTAIILCLLGLFSACEELLITIWSKDLNRDRKSIFTI